MKNAFAYRQKSASGFTRDARTLFFYEEGSPDSAPPIVILPEATTEETAQRVLETLGYTLIEWEEL